MRTSVVCRRSSSALIVRAIVILCAVVLGAVVLMDGTVVVGAPPKKLLLIGQGPDGHARETHEFMAGAAILEKCLARVKGVATTVVRADEPWRDGPRQIAEADGVALYLSQGSQWMQADPRRYDALTKLAVRGGGVVALHWAVGAKDAKYVPGQLKLLGGSRGGPDRKYTVAEFDLKFPDPKHPILTAIQPRRVHDELYYRLDLVTEKPAITPLITAAIDGREETVGWAWERADGGRSFGYVGMHFHRNWALEEYRRLAVQGIAWSLKLDIPAGGMNVDIAAADLKLPDEKPSNKESKNSKSK